MPTAMTIDPSGSLMRIGLTAMCTLVAACGSSGSDDGDSRSCDTIESGSDLAQLSTDECYEVTNPIVLETGHWTLEAGTTLYFHDDTGLTVRAGATLDINGTNDDPVLLRGDKEAMGAWRGLNILAPGPHKLSHLSVHHAGGASWEADNEFRRGALVIGDDAVDIAITDAHFEDNEFAAITTDAPDAEVTLAGSHFSSNDYPLRVQANHVANIAMDNTFDDNRHDVILIHTDEPLTGDATWQPLAAPFGVETTLPVEATLTLTPGVRLYFERHAGLDVDGGLVDAQGTDSDPVVFRGANDTSGYWRGIRFRNTPPDTINHMSRVGVFHAGSDRWDELWSNSQANVLVHDGGRLTINHSTISEGDYHGISVRDGVVEGCEGLQYDDLHRHAEHSYDGDEVCF